MGKQGGLDRYRLIAAFLVIAIHTSPLLSVNENADFFLTRIFARMASKSSKVSGRLDTSRRSADG